MPVGAPGARNPPATSPVAKRTPGAVDFHLESCSDWGMTVPLPRRFHLERDEDVTGTSGTGHVAQGVQFANGQCAMTWLSAYTSVAVYHSIDVLERIHGHDGRTRVVWDDPSK